MIINLNYENEVHKIESDLCIIGSGAAGLSIANEFRATNKRIVLIESGDLKYSDKNQELNDGELALFAKDKVKKPENVLKRDRIRSFGGTTAVWGGMCAALDNIDFTQRNWVPNSGWPISRTELIPYYNRVSHILNIDEYEFNKDRLNYKSEHKPLEFKSDIITKIFYNTEQLRFGDIYYNKLRNSQSFKVLLNATVTDLLLNNENNNLDKVVISVNNNPNQKIQVNSKIYILAAGAIENARILLNSNVQRPNGVGNENGLVGCYFQGHGYTVMPQNTLSIFTDNNLNLYRDHLRDRRHNQCCFLSFSEFAQQSHSLLNCYIGVNAPWFYQVQSSKLVEEIQQEYEKLLVQLKINTKNRNWYLGSSVMFFEQEPQKANQVTLGEDRDWLNKRKVKVKTQVSDLQFNTIINAYKLLAKKLGSHYMGKVKLIEEWSILFDSLHDGLSRHHFGTTRMSETSVNGVVDKNCKMHYVNNLYVAGASVFPTSSAANPTYTILALSLRLADHLKKII